LPREGREAASNRGGSATRETTLMYAKHVKRDPLKRRVELKRDLWKSKETYNSNRGGLATRETTLMYTKYVKKRATQGTYISQKRPMEIKRDPWKSKETYEN